MINGKLFAKFQKLLPKMNKALKAKNCTPNAFFMADSEGCAATDGFSLLYAPVENACEQPVALTEMPKAKFGDAVFIEDGKFDATVKDGGTSVNVRKDETGKEKMSDFRYRDCNEFAAFTDWCQGLPSVLDTCYYYNRSAVEDLGAILEETAEEKARFSEPEAERRLTWLIYRELSKGAAKRG